MLLFHELPMLQDYVFYFRNKEMGQQQMWCILRFFCEYRPVKKLLQEGRRPNGNLILADNVADLERERKENTVGR